MKKTKLTLSRETTRVMGWIELDQVRAGYVPATDGAGNCPSELSDCPSHAWSCINMSCTIQGDTA